MTSITSKIMPPMTPFQALSDKKLDALIDLLTVECITAHLQRRTELVWRLAQELGVEVRRYWRPDERWLSGYQKIQLAHLIGELRGPVYAKAAELKKKSELVSDLAKLFTDAAEGRLEDAKVAAKLNAWLPSNLREAAASRTPRSRRQRHRSCRPVIRKEAGSGIPDPASSLVCRDVDGALPVIPKGEACAPRDSGRRWRSIRRWPASVRRVGQARSQVNCHRAI